jgi:hypothetical protein
MAGHATSFNITSAKEFLDKLHEEQKDFVASDCMSERHALNAIITAYHLHEWVWADWLQNSNDLRKKWNVDNHKQFFKKLTANDLCPALEDACAITNGTKHFKNKKIATGQHDGAFQRGVFQEDAFDVSYLWIERAGKKQRAEEFINELVKFWDQFFAENAHAWSDR